MKYGKKQVKAAMQNGRLLMVTLGVDGASYALDHGVGISAKLGRELTMPTPTQQGDFFLTPNEDGLFEGFTQTWSLL